MIPTAQRSRDDVVAAIDRVVDPCSSAMGLPLGLAELGLATVEACEPDAGRVSVRLRLTSPCCAYGPTMAKAIEHELTALAWIHCASVEIDHAAIWTELHITPDAAARLEVRRENTRAVTGVRPYPWTSEQEDNSRE